VSRLPPLPLPGIEGARLPSITHSCHHHYAHLSFPVTRISVLLDSHRLNHLFITSPICQFPISVPCCCSDCRMLAFCPCADVVPVLFNVCSLLNFDSQYLLLISGVRPYRMQQPSNEASGMLAFWLVVTSCPGAAADGTGGA
jgi:hypothetical protein